MRDNTAKIICAVIAAAATLGTAYIGNNYSQLKDDYSDLKTSFQELQKENKELTEANQELENKIAKLEDTPQSNPNASDTEDAETTPQEKDSKNTSKSQLPLTAHAWKDQSYYKEYSGDGNVGFKMYGTLYTNGFTISMGSFYNVWNNGQQYAVYNIEAIASKHKEINMLVGHVDGYTSSSVILKIFLDKDINEAPDYEYTIKPELTPQSIKIGIGNKKGMTIMVDNQGNESNALGFANINFQ